MHSEEPVCQYSGPQEGHTYVYKCLLDVFQGWHPAASIVLASKPGVNSLQGAVGTPPPCIIALVLHSKYYINNNINSNNDINSNNINNNNNNDNKNNACQLMMS